MPVDFLKCVKDGGRVRTKSLSGGKYIRICFLNGKSFEGEVKESKSEKISSKIKSLKGKKNA